MTKWLLNGYIQALDIDDPYVPYLMARAIYCWERMNDSNQV